MIALTIALLILPAAVCAASEQRASLTLTVNGVEHGQTIAVIREDDILVEAGDLVKAGVLAAKAPLIRLNDRSYVSLRTLAPLVGYAFSEEALSLAVTADPQLLERTAVDLSTDRVWNGDIARGKSAFLNYSISEDAGARPALGGYAEVGMTVGDGLLYSSATLRSGSFRRGVSSARHNDAARLRSTTLGDSYVLTGPLGSATVIGGIEVARTFDLQPDYIRFPTPQISGSVSVPSTADIYVNGAPYRTIELPPGPFDIRSLPPTTGGQVTQVVIHDPFGGQQSLTTPYYVPNDVLKQGVTDYAYDLGFIRTGALDAAEHYGPLAALGRYRIGLSDAVTLGGRLEVAPSLLSGGPQANVRLAFGELSVAAGVSNAGGLAGHAESFALNRVSRAASFGVALTAKSAWYATASLRPQDDRPTLAEIAFVSLPFTRRDSLRVDVTRSIFRDSGTTLSVGVIGSLRLSERASLTFGARTGSVSLSAGPALAPVSDSVFALLNVATGRASQTVVGVSNQNGRTSGSIAVQKSTPVEPGLGYRVQTDLGTPAAIAASTDWHTRAGDLQADFSRTGDGQTTLFARASGGIAFVGGKAFATAPIGQAFGLVQIPGLSGVPVLLDNQEIGRTDSAGNLVVPRLLSYYPNTLRVSDRALPAGVRIDAPVQIVAPADRAGAVVRFKVLKFQAFIGTLIASTNSGPVVPSFGQMVVALPEREAVSDLGESGEFYFENLPKGTYSARVAFRSGDCRLQVTIPASTATLVRLGELRCAAASDA